ncbi:MAG: hypothetical protein H0W76_12485 [Pyrinomonadaceae bacterium]|nr:hypothetical protein [Pyrinomonadaceae bacterium]
MIREVKDAPLAFERIVVEEMSGPLAAHGLRFEEPFHLYKNDLVPFTRTRQGIQESIRFARRSYNEETMAAGVEDDEVDQPRSDDPQGLFWPSRHYLIMQFIHNKYVWSHLLRTGTLGGSLTGEELWYYTDEADLRRLLHEVLPLILSAGLQRFDDRLEDALAERQTPTPA